MMGGGIARGEDDFSVEDAGVVPDASTTCTGGSTPGGCTCCDATFASDVGVDVVSAGGDDDCC